MPRLDAVCDVSQQAGCGDGTRLTDLAHRLSSAETDPDMVASQLLDALSVTTHRVVIDDIAGLLRVLGARVQDYLAALGDHLYAAGVTSLFLFEIDAFTGFQFDLARTPLSLVADNVMIIQQVAVGRRLHRLVAVLKMRFSAHDQTLRELVLDPRGVRVLASAETSPDVLNEAATMGGGSVPPNAATDAAADPNV